MKVWIYEAIKSVGLAFAERLNDYVVYSSIIHLKQKKVVLIGYLLFSCKAIKPSTTIIFIETIAKPAFTVLIKTSGIFIIVLS